MVVESCVRYINLYGRQHIYPFFHPLFSQCFEFDLSFRVLPKHKTQQLASASAHSVLCRTHSALLAWMADSSIMKRSGRDQIEPIGTSDESPCCLSAAARMQRKTSTDVVIERGFVSMLSLLMREFKTTL